MPPSDNIPAQLETLEPPAELRWRAAKRMRQRCKKDQSDLPIC
jgi:hypothetical protein